MCGLGIVGALTLADPICNLLFGPEYVGASSVLRILAFAAAGQIFLDINQGVLIALGARLGLLLVGAVAVQFPFFLRFFSPRPSGRSVRQSQVPSEPLLPRWWRG